MKSLFPILILISGLVQAEVGYPEPNPPHVDLNQCHINDVGGFFHEEQRYDVDFSPVTIDLVGLALENTCVFSWWALNIETVGTMGIRLEGIYTSAAVVDLSTAPWGIAFVGDYSKGSVLANKGICLRGNPQVCLKYDPDCDCIRANRPVVWE